MTVDLHVLFQVLFHKLKDQHELGLCVDDIVQPQNVGMAQLLHQRDLADRRGWGTFFGIEMDLFERNNLVVEPGSALVYGSVGTLS